MAQYINKDVLLAEIERLENDEFLCDSYDVATGFQSALRMVQEFINTLEVKEVDLEKEFFDWYHEEKNRDYNASILYERYGITSKKLAKHFYELGLKAQKGE